MTDPNGASRRPLLPSLRAQFDPVWSPNGERIAFESKRQGGWQITVAMADGSKAFDVTHGRSDHFDPSWSPDGTHIVYSRVANGRANLFITLVSAINHPRRLTHGRALQFDPSWSPDGKLIAFDRLRGHDYDIWTIKAANGAVVSHLTFGPATTQTQLGLLTGT